MQFQEVPVVGDGVVWGGYISSSDDEDDLRDLPITLHSADIQPANIFSQFTIVDLVDDDDDDVHETVPFAAAIDVVDANNDVNVVNEKEVEVSNAFIDCHKTQKNEIQRDIFPNQASPHVQAQAPVEDNCMGVSLLDREVGKKGKLSGESSEDEDEDPSHMYYKALHNPRISDRSLQFISDNFVTMPTAKSKSRKRRVMSSGLYKKIVDLEERIADTKCAKKDLALPNKEFDLNEPSLPIHLDNVPSSTIQRSISQCKTCTFIFQCSKLLHEHESIVHGVSAKTNCTRCGFEFATKLTGSKYVMTVHEKRGKFMCLMCGLRFSQKSVLSRHMIMHSDDPNLNCIICNTLFLTFSDFKNHNSTSKLCLPGARNHCLRYCIKLPVRASFGKLIDVVGFCDVAKFPLGVMGTTAAPSELSISTDSVRSCLQEYFNSKKRELKPDNSSRKLSSSNLSVDSSETSEIVLSSKKRRNESKPTNSDISRPIFPECSENVPETVNKGCCEEILVEKLKTEVGEIEDIEVPSLDFVTTNDSLLASSVSMNSQSFTSNGSTKESKKIMTIDDDYCKGHESNDCTKEEFSPSPDCDIFVQQPVLSDTLIYKNPKISSHSLLDL